MRPHARIAVLASAAALALPLIPGSAAEAVTRTRVQTFELVRTTNGPASFSFITQTALSAQDPHGFEGVIVARVSHGHVLRAASLGSTTFDFDDDPQVSAAGQKVFVCEPVGGCIVNETLAYGTATTSSDPGGPGVDNRVFIVDEGPTDVTFHGHGWVLRRPALNYRYVAAGDAEASGVFTGVTAAELFQRAKLRGGSTGSIAAAEPPCSFSTPGAAGEPVPRGIGRATLSGGGRPQSLTCPGNVGHPFLTDMARGRTTWTFSGAVVGDDTGVNVPLFVIDLPRRV